MITKHETEIGQAVAGRLIEALPALAWKWNLDIFADPERYVWVGRESGGGRLILETYVDRILDLDTLPDDLIDDLVADGVEEYNRHH